MPCWLCVGWPKHLNVVIVAVITRKDSEADMAATPKRRTKARTTKTTATRRASASAKPEEATKAKPESSSPSVRAKTDEAAPNSPNTDITVVRRGAIIDDVVASTGMRRSDVKDMLEATLSSLAGHLSDNTVLQLPPLGKIRVARVRTTEAGKVVTCKVRVKPTALDAGQTSSSHPTRFSTAAE